MPIEQPKDESFGLMPQHRLLLLERESITTLDTPFIYNPDQGRRLYHLCRSMRYPSGNTAQPQHPI